VATLETLWKGIMKNSQNLQMLFVLLFVVSLAAVAYFVLSYFLGTLRWSFPELF
jgi:hypothetical protein